MKSGNLTNYEDPMSDAENKKEISEYNRYAIPSSIQIAKDHAKAKSPGDDNKDKNFICPCCGFKIEKKESGFWCENKELDYLGSAFPILLKLIKLVIIFICIPFFGIVAIPHFIYVSKECGSVSFSAFYTCANEHFNFLKVISERKIFDVIFGAWSIVAVVIIKIMILNYKRKLEQENENVADFTLIMRHLPRDQKAATKEILNLSKEENFKDSIEINFVYDFGNLYKIEEEIEEKLQERKKLLKRSPEKTAEQEPVKEHAHSETLKVMEQNKSISESIQPTNVNRSNTSSMKSDSKSFNESGKEAINENEMEIKELYKELKEEEQRLKEKKNEQVLDRLFLHQCFVTFNRKDLAKRIYNENKWNKLKNFLFLSKKIEISFAPKPEDIIWKNLGITKEEKFYIRFRVFVVQTIILLLAFVLIYLIHKKMIEDEGDAASFLKSFLVLIINIILEKLFNYFITHGKHKTYSTPDFLILLYLIPLLIFNFFGFELLPLIEVILEYGCPKITEDTEKYKEIIARVFFVVIMQGLIEQVKQFFDYKEWRKNRMRKKIEKTGQK